MKKTMLAGALAALLFSCNKDIPLCGEAASGHTRMEVSFGDYATDTRAFLDEVAQSWPHERAVHTLSLHIYTSDGALFRSVTATAEQIARGKIPVDIPSVMEGCELAFYAVANSPATYNSSSEVNMQAAKVAYAATAMNGDVTEMMNKSLDSRGFLMTGRTKVVVANGGKAHIVLERAVAKIALRLRVSPDFEAAHDGTMILGSAIFYAVPGQTYLVKTDPIRNPTRGGNTNLHNLVHRRDGEWYEFLVYCFESDYRGESYQTQLRLTFNLRMSDGRTLSRGYLIPVDPQNPGLVRRNVCYRITGEITSLGFSQTDFSYSILPWQSLPGSTVNIGG